MSRVLPVVALAVVVDEGRRGGQDRKRGTSQRNQRHEKEPMGAMAAAFAKLKR